jgi:hypothetical protein
MLIDPPEKPTAGDIAASDINKNRMPATMGVHRLNIPQTRSANAVENLLHTQAKLYRIRWRRRYYRVL